MPPAYRFLDRWVVPAPIDRVYDTIGDVLGYERWWTDFVIRASGEPPRNRARPSFDSGRGRRSGTGLSVRMLIA